MGTDVRIVNMEALTIGPGESVLLRIGAADLPDDDHMDDMMASFHEALDAVGLEGRYVILLGNVEVTRVEKPVESHELPADYADSAE